MNSIEELAAALNDLDLTVRLDATSIPRPSLHDMDYNIIVFAYTLHRLAREKGGHARRAPLALVKLVHFVAIRPHLSVDLKDWLERNRKGQRDFYSWPKFPRGYLVDLMLDSVISLLEMNAMVVRDKSDLLAADGEGLASLARPIITQGLFSVERGVVDFFSQKNVPGSKLGIP